MVLLNLPSAPSSFSVPTPASSAAYLRAVYSSTIKPVAWADLPAASAASTLLRTKSARAFTDSAAASAAPAALAWLLRLPSCLSASLSAGPALFLPSITISTLLAITQAPSGLFCMRPEMPEQREQRSWPDTLLAVQCAQQLSKRPQSGQGCSPARRPTGGRPQSVAGRCLTIQRGHQTD